MTQADHNADSLSGVLPPATPPSRSLLRRYRCDVFVALWIPYALLVRHFWFVTDDAFISFRYAQNLVRGHGLRFNLAEHVPVEGYSNFLWVLVCAVFESFRMNINLWPLLLSVACGTVLLWLVFDTLRRRLEVSTTVAALATLTLACFPPFALWSTSGMETVPFALLVFVTFERLALRRAGPDGIGGGIAGLLLALIRVEGLAWVVVILIVAILARRIARQRCLRALVTCALIVGIGYAVYFGWRCWYFETLLPNTVYAKAELDTLRLVRGFNYVLSFALAFLTPFLIVPGTVLALRPRRIAVGLPIAAMAWAFPAYAVVVTGDFMAMGRFLIPGLPFGTILLAWMLDDLWNPGWARRGAAIASTAAIVALGLLPGLPPPWNLHVVPQTVRERFRFRFNKPEFDSEYDRWQYQIKNTAEGTRLGQALRSYVSQRTLPDEQPSYVCGGIGAVAYYSDVYIYDSNGLVTPEVARRKLDHSQKLRSPGHEKWVPSEYFLKDNPTILYAIVEENADPRGIAGACVREARALREDFADLQLYLRYVIDFARVPTDSPSDTPRYILTWTRITAGTDPREVWEDFGERVRGLLRGQHLSWPLARQN
jgi:arabinofuranosyltransferase